MFETNVFHLFIQAAFPDAPAAYQQAPPVHFPIPDKTIDLQQRRPQAIEQRPNARRHDARRPEINREIRR